MARFLRFVPGMMIRPGQVINLESAESLNNLAYLFNDFIAGGQLILLPYMDRGGRHCNSMCQLSRDSRDRPGIMQFSHNLKMSRD